MIQNTQIFQAWLEAEFLVGEIILCDTVMMDTSLSKPQDLRRGERMPMSTLDFT